MTSVPPALPGTAQNKRFKEKPRIYAPATWKGGHESMINRRHDGRASCLAWYSPKQALERKPRIYAPATWKGGHESGRTGPPATCRAENPGGGPSRQPAWSGNDGTDPKWDRVDIDGSLAARNCTVTHRQSGRNL